MKRILFIVLLAVCTINLCAKEPQRPTSYNYQRGVEAINNEDDEEGEKYLKQELDDNPKNGYAYAWLAGVELRKKEIGNAILMLNNAIKYIPKSDKYYHAWANSTLSSIYYDLNDTIKTIDFLSRAIKAEPKNYDWWSDRGAIYLAYEQYDLAIADFQQCINLEPTRIAGYLWMGEVYYVMEQYEKALEQYQYAHKLGARSYTYGYLAKTYLAMKKYEEAADNVIKAFKEKHFEDNCAKMLTTRNDEFFEELVPRIKVQITANPNTVEWQTYLLYIYTTTKKYEEAIDIAQKIKSLDANPFYVAIVSYLYQSLGDYSTALEYAQEAYEADTTELDYLINLITIHDALDNTQPRLALIEQYITRQPESANAYHNRAQHYFYQKDYDKALEDFTTCIVLDTTQYHARLMRGRIYLIKGDSVKSEKDFQRVLTSSADAMHKTFSYILLNRHEEAKELLDSIVKADTVSHDERYNIACAYSLRGDTELAFEMLEQELNDGFVDFNHVRRDIDFAPIHGERFDSLINLYEKKAQERIRVFKGENGAAQTEERVVEVPFSKVNGVTKVDCTINKLPLNFIFDTGASDVTISQVEANFMYKNGYLSERDVVGKKAYQVADGSISVGTTIILKEIQFAGLILKDVRASVVESQNAPLLLGQTVLQRLGKIEIDNAKRVLKITTCQ